MVSLAALWQAHGVRPAAVVGHSQGEIAAACVAGALSLEDAALVVALRSKILVPLEGRSGMVSLALTPDAARDFTARWGDRVTVAALNGPSSTVVSADADTVTDILATAERENVRARRVGIDYASHSAHVETVRDEMLRLLAPITPRTPDVPFLSTVTGDWLDGPTDAAYWYDNLRRPVLLEPAVRALTAAGHGAFVEVSPHPVLTGPVQDTVETAAGPRQAVVTGTLRRDDGGPARFQASLGALWARGADVDWTPVFAGLTPRRVDLPTYAFQRRRHWISGAPPRLLRAPPRFCRTPARAFPASAPTFPTPLRTGRTTPRHCPPTPTPCAWSRRAPPSYWATPTPRPSTPALLQGPRHRLRHRRGTARPAQRPHRTRPSRDRGLRVPDPGPPRRPAERRHRRAGGHALHLHRQVWPQRP